MVDDFEDDDDEDDVDAPERLSTREGLDDGDPVDLMCEPGRLVWRSIYNFTTVRNSMKPSPTVRMKISVETAQNK